MGKDDENSMGSEKRSKRRRIFSRKEKFRQDNINDDVEETAPDAGALLLEFMRLPVDIFLNPVSFGCAMGEFLGKSLGLENMSIELISGRLEPLLLETQFLPERVLRGGAGHDDGCPSRTGLTLLASPASPESLCIACRPECRLGQAILRMPLFAGGAGGGPANDATGVLTMSFAELPPVIEDETFFTAFSRRVSSEFEIFLLSQMNRLLEITDNLTRAYNYRYFMRTLEMEVERSRRYDHEFSILLIDIGGFRDFNSRYGYEAGDAMLREVSRLIRGNIRATDLAARYSGQQFAVILPETSRAKIETVVNKITEVISDFRLPLPGRSETGSVTVRIGGAAFPIDATVTSRLIICAEDSLRRTKYLR